MDMKVRDDFLDAYEQFNKNSRERSSKSMQQFAKKVFDMVKSWDEDEKDAAIAKAKGEDR